MNANVSFEASSVPETAMTLEANIARLEHEIKACEEEITHAGLQVMEAIDAHDDKLFDYWSNKEQLLRNKEQLLRTEKEQLRTQEQQVRRREQVHSMPLESGEGSQVAPVRAFKLTAVFVRGATWKHLRRNVYQLLERHGAIRGSIAYSLPRVANSDLNITVYFLTYDKAVDVRGALLEFARHRYPQGYIPTLHIKESADRIDIYDFVTISGYDLDDTSPARDGFLIEDAAASSLSSDTRKYPEHILERESIFDFAQYDSTIHAAHLNWTIKGTDEDSVGNIIPLPSSVHQLFDNNLNKRKMPLISIEPLTDASSLGEPIMDRGVAYHTIAVRVHFFPSREARQQIAGLKEGAVQHADGIYDLTIQKREAVEFIKQVNLRHRYTQHAWSHATLLPDDFWESGVLPRG